MRTSLPPRQMSVVDAETFDARPALRENANRKDSFSCKAMSRTVPRSRAHSSHMRRRYAMKLVITVEDIKGQCPAYRAGDRIVLDNGFKFNLRETTA